MGYRLNICYLNTENYPWTIDDIYYGTKLYGYGMDLKESKSYNYLIKKEKFEGDELFVYGNNNLICLTYKELKNFLILYNEDYNKYGYNYLYLDEEEKNIFINDETIKDLLNNYKWEYENFIIYWN